MLKFAAIIPARYQSSRFPGKPLINLGGQTMIERVYRQVQKAGVIGETLVATDDARIVEAVEAFGGRAVMTAAEHLSGTDRCNEAADFLSTPADVIINVQGDEPFIAPLQIELLCSAFDHPETDIATLVKPFSNPQDVADPNKVKVVRDKDGFALYFSRSPVPFHRKTAEGAVPEGFQYLKHIGIYAYRRSILKTIAALPPALLEQMEQLEQLRWLENGLRIKTAETDLESEAIDTPADLEFINKRYFSKPK